MEFLYESPSVDVLEIMAEGILCSSVGDSNDDWNPNMNPEAGNM